MENIEKRNDYFVIEWRRLTACDRIPAAEQSGTSQPSQSGALLGGILGLKFNFIGASSKLHLRSEIRDDHRT
jgi:hypothetical protein